MLRASLGASMARRLGAPEDARPAWVSDDQLLQSAAAAMASSDARYADAANELRLHATIERPAWPPSRQGGFDVRMGMFDDARQRRQWVLHHRGMDPRAVQAAQAAWRAEIDYLQDSVLPAIPPLDDAAGSPP